MPKSRLDQSRGGEVGAEPTRKKRCSRRSAVSSSTANKNKKFTTGGARIDAGDTSEIRKVRV